MLRNLLSVLLVLTAASAADGRIPEARAPNADDADAAGVLSDPGPTLLPLPRPLPFFYDLYTFRGEEGKTTVVASFAVPVGSLRRDEDHEVHYRLDVTLVLSDTARHSVSRADDSVFVSMPRRLDGDHLLFTHVELQAPPSNATLQRVIMTDANTAGRGQLYSSPFLIPDYGGRNLMVSDIALGQPGAEEGWRRGDVTLALLPTSQLPESEFDVYYEIYNLPFGTRYATEISIDPVDDAGEARTDGGTSALTRFDGESEAGSDGMQTEMRRVGASLERGRYRLTVTVTDQDTGRTARQAREFEVRGWSRGATLVPALPYKG